jgi:hypothetical protein
MLQELAYLGIDSPAQVRLFALGTRRALAPLLETGALNSDDFPRLEFGAARARFIDRHERMLDELARDPVPVLEILSGLDAPELPGHSADLARVHPRFHDVRRANQIAAALGYAPAAAAATIVPRTDDAEHLRRVRTFRPDMTATAWQHWFRSLFELAKVLVPNGGGAAIAGFVRSEPLASALEHAPPEIGEKLDYLLAVSARDLDRMRLDGPRLLAGDLLLRDPAFHDYVSISAAAACLAAPVPDGGCRWAIAQIDRVGRESPAISLLRAHRALR